jgi:uncharacterized YigZ family protein
MIKRLVPRKRANAEIQVANSRFIANVAPAFTVEEAKSFISEIKGKYADASHNVPAYIIGHGNSRIAHCSDDGEPSGTAGRPVLAVLQGSGLGDIAVVITRYFGGTKLGTGGLVRAYSDTMRTVLDVLPLAQKVSAITARGAFPYKYFEQIKLLINKHNGMIIDEKFGVDVSMTLQFREEDLPAFQEALKELSNGILQATEIQSNQNTIMPI